MHFDGVAGRQGSLVLPLKGLNRKQTYSNKYSREQETFTANAPTISFFMNRLVRNVKHVVSVLLCDVKK